MMSDQPRKGTCPVCRAPATYYGETTQYCISDYQKLKEQRDELTEALKFYANRDNYDREGVVEHLENDNDGNLTDWWVDYGHTAREVLTKHGLNGGE